MPTEETRFLNILLPGDANSSGSVNGIDIVYLVNYFKGYMDPHPIPYYREMPMGIARQTGLMSLSW
jgi:hypothetical protein